MKKHTKLTNRKWKLSKLIILMLVVALLATFLTACKTQPVEQEPQVTELSLWYYWDVSATRQRLLKMVDEFNQSHDDITVIPKYVPDEDFKKTLALAIADGATPDMAIVDSSDVKYYDSMTELMDVSAYVDREEYFKTALTSCTDGVRTLGIPLGMNCLCLYYNKELLDEKGFAPPENMDEFVEMAGELTTDKTYGSAFPTLQSEESVFCFLPILWGEGGNLTQVNSEAGYRAFDRCRQLVENHGMSSLVANMTLSDIADEFAKGNIGMIFSTTMREKQLREDNPDLQFGVAKLPTEGISVVGGEVLTVTNEQHRKATETFLAYMSAPEQIKAYLDDMMYFSPRKDILQWQMEQDPSREFYLEYLNQARAREFTPYWPTISIAVADALKQIVMEDEDPNLVENLAIEIETIRREYDEEK